MKKKKDKNNELTEKCAEYLDGWKRAKADYENLQKNLAQSAEDSRKRIKISFLHDLLPVLDNFSQAVAHVPNLDEYDEKIQKDLENWLQGVTFIQKQLEDVIKELGVEQIVAEAGQFDPNLHESVDTATDPEKHDQEIIKQIQPGWKIGETVIRPAKVVINNKENN
ncbi:MAG: nucleotide exchange factor GrpE [Patescibacteria group bacterium]